MPRLDLRLLLVAAGLLGVSCVQPLDARAPSVSEVTPALVCNARDTADVTIKGANFLPLVSGAAGKPHLELPKVFLTSPSGDVPLLSVVLTDASTLLVELPQGLPEGLFAVTVESPGGKRGALEAAVTVVPPPAISTLTPDRGFLGDATTVSVKGLGFRATPALVLKTTPATPLTAVTLLGDGEVRGTIPAGLAPGTYDLAVTNPEGCTNVKKGAFQVTRLPSITLGAIDPVVGWTGAPTRVTLTGTNFAATPEISLLVAGTKTALTRIAFLSAKTLTAVVPAGLPVGGAYDLLVENPDSGGTASLEGAFAVVKDPPPAIDSVDPSSGVSNSPTPVTIAGRFFDPKATVELVAADGRALSLTALAVTPTRITGLVPTAAAGAGVFLVRVTNPDKSRGDFSAFEVRNPAGNLGSFGSSPSLKTARQNLSALASRDGLGGRFLLAVGGDDGTRALQTVEISALDPFGRAGEWKVQRSRLLTARSGHAAAIKDGFLFVIGGTADLVSSLATVERAQLLGSDPAAGELPAITSSTRSGGTLQGGTWYYAVSAVLGAGDPDNPLGETVASEEEVVRLSGILPGVTLTWKTVPGADHYRVYRTDAPDGVSGTAHLLADNVPGATFTDDGSKATDPTVAPLPPGSLGVFLTMPVTLNTARRSAGAAVATDPAGQTFLYVSGGIGASTTDGLDDLEFAAFGGRGELKAFAPANEALLRARISHAAVVADPLTAPGLATAAPYLILTGGYGFPPGGGTRSALSSTETAEILAGGRLGPFIAAPSYTTARAGPVALFSANAFHVFGGLSGITVRDSGDVALADACTTTCPALKPWTFASSRLRTGRAFAAGVLERSTWFVLGGSGGTKPLGSVEQASY